MTTTLAPHTRALVERMTDAARYRLPLRLHAASGAVTSGRVLAVECDAVVLRDDAGRRTRFPLADLVRADRADGRQWWPPRGEATP
jgi:hypothetical protein